MSRTKHPRDPQRVPQAELRRLVTASSKCVKLDEVFASGWTVDTAKDNAARAELSAAVDAVRKRLGLVPLAELGRPR